MNTDYRRVVLLGVGLLSVSIYFGLAELGRTQRKAEAFSMVPLGRDAVSVMDNQTGQVTFYYVAGDKMGVMRNPDDEQAHQMVLTMRERPKKP